MMTKEEAKYWLVKNSNYITLSQKFSEDKLRELFEVYFLITGEFKDSTNCGRCILNMKKVLAKHLVSIEKEYTEYKVYKTSFGHLTFKESGKYQTSIYADSQEEANLKLVELKSR